MSLVDGVEWEWRVVFGVGMAMSPVAGRIRNTRISHGPTADSFAFYSLEAFLTPLFIPSPLDVGLSDIWRRVRMADSGGQNLCAQHHWSLLGRSVERESSLTRNSRHWLIISSVNCSQKNCIG